MAARGHEVGIIADGELSTPPGVAGSTYQVLTENSDETPIGQMLQDRATLLHVWTPRERVRRWVDLFGKRGLKYVVHLEDDEPLVTSSQMCRSVSALAAMSAEELDDLIPIHLAHPLRSQTFLARAAGVTLITKRLRSLVPECKPVAVLEPGVDTVLFGLRLTSSERAARRASLGLTPSTTLLAYHGSVHPAIQRDVFSLYTAVSKLRRSGLDVRLLRCGNEGYTTEVSTAFLRANGVIPYGYIAREELPAMLELADIFVQPGWPGPFNAHRLPSKVLEFFAMGRPVILPHIYSGLKCVDKDNAIFLRQGGADEIVRHVAWLRSNPRLAQQIGANGRRLAKRDLEWKSKIEPLEAFYKALQE